MPKAYQNDTLSTPNGKGLARLRARLLAIEDSYADTLSEALPLLRSADEEVRKDALAALKLTPERCAAALEAAEEVRS